MAFLRLVQKKFNAQGVRHSALREEPINKVAVLGGSGSFAISAAIKAGADALITADLKYHQFYQAEGKILLVDIGHYESEQYTKGYLLIFLGKDLVILQSFYQTKTPIPLSIYNMAKKKTEANVEEKLRALYDLQLIHSRVDTIRNVRGELPLEVEDLEDEVAGLSKRQEKLDGELGLIDDQIKAKKIQIEDSAVAIKSTQNSKNVRNNREFNS